MEYGITMDTINSDVNKDTDINNLFEGNASDAYSEGINVGRAYTLESYNSDKIQEDIDGGVSLICAMEDSTKLLAGLGNESNDSDYESVFGVISKSLTPYKVDLTVPGLESEDADKEDKKDGLLAKIKLQLKKAYEWLKNVIKKAMTVFGKLSAKAFSVVVGLLNDDKIESELKEFAGKEVLVGDSKLESQMRDINKLLFHLTDDEVSYPNLDNDTFEPVIKDILELVKYDPTTFALDEKTNTISVLSKKILRTVSGKDVVITDAFNIRGRELDYTNGELTGPISFKIGTRYNNKSYTNVKVSVDVVLVWLSIREDIISAAKEASKIKLDDVNKKLLEKLKDESLFKDKSMDEVFKLKKSINNIVILNNQLAVSESITCSKLAMLVRAFGKKTLAAAKKDSGK